MKRMDSLVAGIVAALAVAEMLILPQRESLALLIPLAILQGAVFLAIRRAPLLVGLLALGLDRLRDDVGVVSTPVGTVLVQMFIFYGIAAYSRHRWLALPVALAAVVANKLYGLQNVYLTPFEVERWRLVGVVLAFVVGLAAAGTALGLALRDRTAEVRRLRREADELDRALPEHEARAAEAEQRRLAVSIGRLVMDLVGRVKRSLGEASVALDGGDASRAAVLLSDTGDGARTVLERMRELLDRIRVDRSVPMPVAPARSVVERAESRVRGHRPLIWLRAHALVFGLCAFGAIEQLLLTVGPPMAERVALAVLVPLPLLARHRFPLAAPLSVVPLILLATWHETINGLVAVAWLTAFAAAFVAGSSRRALVPSAATAAVIAAGACYGMSRELYPPFHWELYVALSVVLATCWIVGRAVRDRLAAAAVVRADIAVLRERRDAAVERAAAFQRAHVAREIHDVVGHAVLVICVQAGAGETLAGRDAAGAREAIRAARRAADSAVDELDRLAQLMPMPDDGGVELALGIDDVPTLVDDLRAGGLDVALSIELDEPDAALSASLVGDVYRIVQESLTNATRYAPGERVTVSITAGDDGALELLISNPLPAASSSPARGGTGLGIENMRERAASHGATLTAGSTDEATWEVRASFARPALTAARVPLRS